MYWQKLKPEFNVLIELLYSFSRNKVDSFTCKSLEIKASQTERQTVSPLSVMLIMLFSPTRYPQGRSSGSSET